MYDLAPNGLLDLFCILAAFAVGCYNYWCMRKGKNGTGYIFFVVFILLFSLFYRPVNGDFWGYYKLHLRGAHYLNKHMEPFYYWVMAIVPDNYLLWRVCVWLPAAIIIAVFLKLLRIPPSIATTFFLMFALTRSYYYVRNVLGLSILYLGLTLFALRVRFVRKTVNIILCVGLIFASWYFHRSMPMYILVGLTAIFLPFDRKHVIVALIAFPFLYSATYIVASKFLGIDEIWIAEGTGVNYLEGINEVVRNWKGMVTLIVDYVPVVYFYIVAFGKALPRNNPDYDAYKVFLLFSFIVFYVSFLFVGQGSAALHIRIYTSSMLPFSVVVSLFFKNYFMSKECRFLIYLVLFSYSWHLFLIVAKNAMALY